jgi:hypothetical protein
MAHFKAALSTSTTGGLNTNVGGHVGFLAETVRKVTVDADEVVSDAGETLAGLLVYESRNINDDSLNTGLATEPVFSRVSTAVTGFLNPDSGATADARRTVELNAVNYFVNASGRTNVRVGVDMLLVTFLSGAQRAFVIDEIDTDASVRRAKLVQTNGELPDFGAVAAIATFKLLQVKAAVGGSNKDTTLASYLGSIFVNQRSITEGLGGGGEASGAAKFYASTVGGDGLSSFVPDEEALVWGGFFRAEKTGVVGPSRGGSVTRGSLLGDGSVVAYAGAIEGMFRPRTQAVAISSTGSYTYTWGPNNPVNRPSTDYLFAPRVVYHVTPLSGSVTITLNFDTTRYTLTDGDEVIVEIYNAFGVDLTVNWPTEFVTNLGAAYPSSQLGTVTSFKWRYNSARAEFVLVYRSTNPDDEPHTTNISAGVDSEEWNPWQTSRVLNMTMAASVDSAADFTLSLAPLTAVPEHGERLTILLKQDTGCDGPLTVTWPTSFTFSGSDGVAPPSNASGSTSVTKWELIYDATVTKWFATRTDYLY